MLCPQCGAEVGNYLRLCNRCKARLGDELNPDISRRQMLRQNVEAISEHSVAVSTYSPSFHSSLDFDQLPEEPVPAGIWFRFLAHIIDCTFLIAIVTVLGEIFFKPLTGMSFYVLLSKSIDFEYTPLSSSLSSITLLFVFAYFIIGGIYYAIFESSRIAATPGKYIFGVFVLSENIHIPYFWRAAARHFSKIFSFLTFGIGFLLPLFNESGQCLHDRLTSCYVLQGQKVSLIRSVVATVLAIVFAHLVITHLYENIIKHNSLNFTNNSYISSSAGV